MGAAKNGRGHPKQKISTIHKVTKSIEVHDPAVGLLLRKKSSGYDIVQFHKKEPISQK